MALRFTYHKEATMRRKFIALISLITVSLISSFSSRVTYVRAEEVNTIYLNLTRVGLFDGENGATIASKRLENAIEYSAIVGSVLPSEGRITSTSGAEFVGWVIPNDLGGLQKLTTVPSVKGIVLQAHFKNDSPVSGDSSSEDGNVLPGLYLKGIGQTYEEAIHLSEGYSTVLNNTEYMALGYDFVAGFTFHLATPSNLSNLGAEILPTVKSNKGDIGYTLSSDNNKPNHTADYLKVNGSKSNGPAQDGGYYYSFGNSDPGTLEFKVSGKFNIYITFWDNFGWARIYVEPAI